ncbi:hypothetical protein ACS0TY_013738 [Phlomoides rotata]
MSRCFPYPPPGYTLSNARKEALIESIKLQKQKVNAEEQRKKDKRREKKEKKKDKKEKKIQNLDKPDIVQGHTVEKLWTQSKVEFLDKGSKTDSEQLERSSLTEEHEKPVCLRVPSSSSESTENSNKRKRLSSPSDVTHGPGNIIRIRLPSKKQKQSDASPNEQQPCSTSGRTHFPSRVKSNIASRLGNECCTAQLVSRNVDQGLVLKIDRQRISSIPKQIVKTPVPSASHAVMDPMKEEELLYKNLTENWVPPQLQNGCFSLDDDNDWLFPSKNGSLHQPEKRQICRVDSISSCSSRSSTLWPVATYLPEVDVFALPFTVPF